jgi:hypothetical protein
MEVISGPGCDSCRLDRGDGAFRRVGGVGWAAGTEERRASRYWPVAMTSARPVRPLPSANGWMVSNCACASAACTSGEWSSPFT